MNKVLFIVNPISGGGRHNFDEKTVGKYACCPYEIVRTEYAGHATLLAQSTDADIVVAVGGDGTVNEVARGIAGSGKALGIIPCGSGNGLANHLGVPRDFQKAVRTIFKGDINPIDVGEVNGNIFCCTCGTGLDAEVSAVFASSRKRGLFTYIVDAVKIWHSYRQGHYAVTVDDKHFETDALLLTVGNANQWGNNAFITPEARVDDGWLELTIVEKIKTLDIPALAVMLLDGRIYHNPKVSHYRGTHIIIQRESEGPVHFDGDPSKNESRLDISIRRNALKAVCGESFKG